MGRQIHKWFFSHAIFRAALIGIVGSVVLVTPSFAANNSSSIGVYSPSNKTDSLASPSLRAMSNKAPISQILHTAIPTTIPTPECPPTVHCVFVPAAYSANNSDVTDYGNYDLANRPTDMKINQIIVHDTEGTLASAIARFQDSTQYVSIQYIVDTDGTIYQMVPNKDIAWQAGNWYVNMHSIAVDHVAHATNGITEFTPAMYQASAQLVKWLATQYSIPLDRQHIVGHDNVPAPTTASISAMHMDPGPFWNWQKYMALLGAPVLPDGNPLTSKFVTVAPIWPLNKQPVTGCFPGTTYCVNTSTDPTSIVYLHTAPSSTSPLLSDPVTGQGTTDIGNGVAKAYFGEKFAVASRQYSSDGIWIQIWYNGQLGWFLSPWTAPTAFSATGQSVTAKSGLASIPVYGRAIPERSEYPASLLAVPPASWYIPAPTPLSYTISAGQKYSVVSADVPTDYFYAWASDSSYPYDHTVFVGATKYIEISLGGRQAFVKASDVSIQ